MTVKIAFDRTHDGIFDWLVDLWTWGPYCHCEIQVDGMCYTADPDAGGLRALKIDLTKDDWDVYEILGVDGDEIVKFFEEEKREHGGYDTIGLYLTQVFGLSRPHPTAWFCSEFCAAALKLDEPWKYSPNSLARYLKSGQSQYSVVN